MALSDFLTGMSPEQNQGLLALASQLLQAGGPQRMPTSFGQALGSGLSAYQQTLTEAEKRKREQALQDQIQQLNSYKLKEAESDFNNQEQQRQRAMQLRDFYIKQGQAAQQGGGIPASMGNDLAPTLENAARLKQSQGQAPGVPSGAAYSNMNLYQQKLNLAQQLRNQGFAQEADAQEAAALKFQPKVKDIKEVQIGGKTLYAPIYEDGSPGQPVPYEAAVKLAFQNAGGKTLGLNPYSGAQVSSFDNTASPESILSAATQRRGQDLTNARALEANQITQGMRADAQQQKVRDENLTKQGQIASFDTMLDSLDRLNAHPGLPRSVGLYSKTPTLPGSDSANFQAELDTFKSQAFLPQVAQLKGMGALSDAEGKKLTAAVGALDPSMSETAFRTSINRIKGQMEQARSRVVNSSRPDVQQSVSSGQVARKSVLPGQVIDGYQFKGGDPSQESSWEKQ